MGKTFNRELIRFLQDAGYTYVRPAKGSHDLWFSPITKVNLTVP